MHEIFKVIQPKVGFVAGSKSANMGMGMGMGMVGGDYFKSRGQ